MAVQKERAILVSRSPGGAEGRILSFLTRNSGLVRVYYRLFPRRTRLEFLEPLQEGELLYSPATERLPARLHAFHCEKIWPAVRSDFDLLVQALHFAEMSSMVTVEGEPEPEIFLLLLGFLDHLESGGDPLTLRAIFELRLLRGAGYEPSLEGCSVCQSQLPAGPVAFSTGEGGVLCEGCLKARGGAVLRLSPGALSFMKKALSLQLIQARRLRLASANLEEILTLLERIVERVFEQRPNTYNFLQKLGLSQKAQADGIAKGAAATITAGKGRRRSSRPPSPETNSRDRSRP